MEHQNECLYKILGVRPDCTLRQIRVAYKKLALANHPDRFRTAAEKEKAHEAFARINNAHQILSDPKSREVYDAMRNMREEMPGNSNKSSTHPYSSGASSRHERPRSNRHQDNHSSRSSTGFCGENKQNQEKHREPRKDKHQKTRNQYSSTSSARQETKGCNTSQSSSSTRSSSYSGGNSSTDRSWEDRQDYDHQGQRQQVYGKCQDGRPCLRCISQQKFCYQHCSQDPNQNRGSYSSSTPPGREKRSRCSGNQNDTSYNDNSDTPIYGVNKNGLPCKRCIKNGGFCYQHETQRHKGSKPRKQNGRSKRSPGPSTSCGSGPFGVTKTGELCKRCIKQCSFCYQHKHQEHRE